jgi:hypothetical protein
LILINITEKFPINILPVVTRVDTSSVIFKHTPNKNNFSHHRNMGEKDFSAGCTESALIWKLKRLKIAPIEFSFALIVLLWKRFSGGNVR